MSVQKFLAKARRSLDAAKLLLEHGFYDEAGSRAYYARFDAARAALLVVPAPAGADTSRTHAGLIAAFGLHVVKPGFIPGDVGRTLGQAQQVRLVADYKGDPIEREDAERLVGVASQFFDAVARLIAPTPAPETRQ